MTWTPGDAIALREVWRGRVWGALPATVVEDGPAQRILLVWPDTPWMVAVGADGEELRIPADEWTLHDRRSSRWVLSFSWPGRAYSCLAFQRPDDRDFTGWYVNLETPVARTPVGFDYTDHLLDVLVSPDRSSWRWKDEDELAVAVERGVFSPADAEAFRAAGEQAIEHLQSGAPPFDRDWSSWRPDPAWSKPELPEGWDRVED
jgi:predicted RNA-binding protein associated with RNAse of E/G family